MGKDQADEESCEATSYRAGPTLSQKVAKKLAKAVQIR
jgi:hypothetical protein